MQRVSGNPFRWPSFPSCRWAFSVALILQIPSFAQAAAPGASLPDVRLTASRLLNLVRPAKGDPVVACCTGLWANTKPYLCWPADRQNSPNKAHVIRNPIWRVLARHLRRKTGYTKKRDGGRDITRLVEKPHHLRTHPAGSGPTIGLMVGLRLLPRQLSCRSRPGVVADGGVPARVGRDWNHVFAAGRDLSGTSIFFGQGPRLALVHRARGRISRAFLNDFAADRENPCPRPTANSTQ